ncbi:alpha/beta fold hydrolase [Aliikangiella sp. G2MR2-5]|uniref:alpha/beta fold hydrolase n=1 Tax=Aliikangiella sp. G2MR2-5 TaxID=2788943 RepID=UPI0018A8FE0B|nr:alpha/beta hydrolase [Aliikangiella sp. G2MR2-5]
MRIVLLRGLGRDQEHWTPLLNALKKCSSDLKIETPDLPGAGVLFKQKSPTEIDAYISALESQVTNTDEPTILVGLSLGGMIALKWAEKYPQKFSQLVLINSSSRLSPFYRRLNLLRILKFPQLFMPVYIDRKESAIYQLTCNKRPLQKSLIEKWVDIQLKHPVSSTNQLRQLIAAFKFSLPKPEKIPFTTILYSIEDPLVSFQCSRDLINYYQTAHYCHSWGGHDLPQDDPEWVAEKLVCIANQAASKIIRNSELTTNGC